MSDVTWKCAECGQTVDAHSGCGCGPNMTPPLLQDVVAELQRAHEKSDWVEFEDLFAELEDIRYGGEEGTPVVSKSVIMGPDGVVRDLDGTPVEKRQDVKPGMRSLNAEEVERRLRRLETFNESFAARLSAIESAVRLFLSHAQDAYRYRSDGARPSADLEEALRRLSE